MTLKKVFGLLVFQFFTVAAYASCPNAEKTLKKDAIIQDLKQLESEFKANYAYYDLKKDIFHQELKKMEEAGLLPENCISDVVLGVSQILALLDDGHTSIESFSKYFDKQFVPFQISMIRDKTGIKFVGYYFNSKMRSFLKNGFPYITHLDGVPMSDWLNTATKYKLNGRRYVSERVSLNLVKNAGIIRRVLNLPKNDSIKVTLSDGARKTFKMDVKLVDTIESTPPLPWNRSKILSKDNIGYLRIYDLSTFDELMEYDRFYERDLISYYMLQDPTAIAIRYWMKKFKSTNGLIIDIRGNLGGSRQIIQTLMPYLMKNNDSPLIYNVSAYRVKDPGDHPFIRFYKSKDDSEVKKGLAKMQFNPNVSKDVLAGFGAYYYAVVSPADNNDDVYHYDKPIVLLIDDSVFSAADNLANAITHVQEVMTVGSETAGGSGGPKSVGLKNSEIKIKYSYMASFKPTGELYNAKGIVPQHIIEPNSEFFIGKSDPAFDYSLQYLKSKK